jgi:uncharacterized protein
MANIVTSRILWDVERTQSYNNCACSVAPLTSPVSLVQAQTSQSWQRPGNTQVAGLPEEHQLLFNPGGAFGPVVLNEAAYQHWRTFDQPRPLTDEIARRLAELHLLHPVDEAIVSPATAAQTLVAWLHVTNACNLRCTYCYVNKSDEPMSAETGKAAVDAIFRSAHQNGFRKIQIKYAGGEASLNFKLVQNLHYYAKDLAEQSAIQLQSVVLSNGIALTHAILDFISAEKIGLMISLDGSEDEHNGQRVFRNGRGSYDHVVRSIDRALTHGIKPHLSITVTGKSVDGIAKAVEFALERDLLFNLNFYRQHNPQQSQVDLRAEDERLIAAMRAAFAVIEQRLPKQSLIGSLVDRASFAGLHTRSCGAGHDYMVIDQKGGVARCQMEIESSITDVFNANPLQEIRLHTGGFQNLSVDEKEGCRDCQWRYWCGGGCSLLTYRVTGRNDVKSPYCNVYKAIYPELLRLEGLRLLKWATPQPTNQLYPN